VTVETTATPAGSSDIACLNSTAPIGCCAPIARLPTQLVGAELVQERATPKGWHALRATGNGIVPNSGT
jgi:hypothetical protein